jgi:hypothetical protein
MSTDLILPPLAILAESAAALVEDAGSNRARANALNKAALALHEGVGPVITHGGFLIESATRAQVHRVDSVYGCNCEAGQLGCPCWHAALVEIIGHAQQRRIPLADRIAAQRKAQASAETPAQRYQRQAAIERQAAAQAALDECFG